MAAEAELRSRKAKATTDKGKPKQAQKKTKKAKKKPTYQGDVIRRGFSYLFEEDDASYLAVFRIMWGLIMTYEALTYTFHEFGKMEGSFYNSIIQFKYYGFEWCVVPEDPIIMKAMIIAQVIFGLGITLGLFYRTSSIMFFLLFSYMYLLEQAMYLNHFYLVCILSFMMILLPCNCCFSLDALLFKGIHSKTCPKWCLIFIKLELAIVYTYAGICKCNEDWLRGEPLRDWMSGKHRIPVVGWLLVKESTAYFMSYAGLLYDLIVAILLLNKRTLKLGVALSIFFHVSNKVVFNIGIFPYMMLASTTFYFEPDWPRKLFHSISGTKKEYKPVVTNSFAETKGRSLALWEWLVILGFTLFLVHQVVVPLRLHTYPGTVAWNEYGHQFSWRMKLRTKQCDAAAMVYNPANGEAFDVNVERFLNRRQYRKMSSRPDMIIQFAHFLRDEFNYEFERKNPNSNVTAANEVYVEAWCQLNGRPYQALTVPTIDLAASEKWASPYPWVTEVTPLTEEHKKNYPWNFEWNFNWLKGVNDTLPPDPRRGKEARKAAMVENANIQWKQWLKERDPSVVYGRIGYE